MFLEKTLELNPALVNAGFQFHQNGQVLPDSFVIDVDTYLENAKKIYTQAKKQNMELYFMLKQVGRNPYLAKALIKIGYSGAVVVDFKEANVMMNHQIPICNVGHLVQAPKHMLQRLVDYGCQYFTVFSIDKIKEIDECAQKTGVVQKLLLKVVGPKDEIYSGQTAGFRLETLKSNVEIIQKLKHVAICGVTSFPCFLYDDQMHSIKPTENFSTLQKAKEYIKECGIVIENLNAPSTTSVETLKQMEKYKIDSAEPGHGLSGTTPLHAKQVCAEKPCVIYVSEISHNFDHKAYCYGGGFYRRSHVAHALIGESMNNFIKSTVEAPNLDSIDYYFGLGNEAKVSDTVIMAFRFQIFVTRSNVVLIEGLSKGKGKIIGIYTSLGDEIKNG